MNRHQILGLLPLLALGACAQPQSDTQTGTVAAAETPAAPIAEEAAMQTVHFSVTGMV